MVIDFQVGFGADCFLGVDDGFNGLVEDNVVGVGLTGEDFCFQICFWVALDDGQSED